MVSLEIEKMVQSDWMIAPRPEILWDLRKRAGWSREKAARALGVTSQTIWRWETGKGKINQAICSFYLQKLGEELGAELIFE